MNNHLPAIKPVGYSREAVLYGIPANKLLWIDAFTAGKMLHPEAKDPAKLARKIYERNKQHFTDRDSVLLDVDVEHLRVDLKRQNDAPDTPKTTLVTQKRKVRFFSIPYGFNKLNLFSQSKYKAKIADWIQDINVLYQKGMIPRWDGDLVSVAHMPKWSRGRGEIIKQIAQERKVSPVTIRRHLKKLITGEPENKFAGMMKGYCHRKYRDIKDKAVMLYSEGVKPKEISERLNVPLSTVYSWIK